MSAQRFSVSVLPDDCVLEVWDDNTAWIVRPNTGIRLRLVEWARLSAAAVLGVGLAGQSGDDGDVTTD